ncbi:hypothetical protein ACO2Q1_16325 [Brevundimonas sp. VNH65]|uniref:hypothetical protein n=1 Tax=Brevundimonas sp. VNH65 TaxID=3400917 RepID=UPI003C1094AA
MPRSDGLTDPKEIVEKIRDDIYRLDDLCLIFARRWSQNNTRQYEIISAEAWHTLSTIVSELLPHARIRMEIGQKAGRTEWTTFERKAAKWFGPIPEVEKIKAVFTAPLGSTVKPDGIPEVEISLHKCLEYMMLSFSTINEHDAEMIGFRCDNEGHIIVFGLHDRIVSGLMEVNINRFCQICMDVTSEI